MLVNVDPETGSQMGKVVLIYKNLSGYSLVRSGYLSLKNVRFQRRLSYKIVLLLLTSLSEYPLEFLRIKAASTRSAT